MTNFINLMTYFMRANYATGATYQVLLHGVPCWNLSLSLKG